MPARRGAGGFDPASGIPYVDTDNEFVCELSDPPLSSVAQAARQVGHTVARLLHRLMSPAGGRARQGFAR